MNADNATYCCGITATYMYVEVHIMTIYNIYIYSSAVPPCTQKWYWSRCLGVSEELGEGMHIAEGKKEKEEEEEHEAERGDEKSGRGGEGVNRGEREEEKQHRREG